MSQAMDFPPDPEDSRFNVEGAICGPDGKLQLSAYMDTVSMAAFRDEPSYDLHPYPEQPGLRQSEIDDPKIRQLHKFLKPWRDSKGRGWIVSRALTGKTESVWISAKKMGSWRLALLLARLQRSIWLAAEEELAQNFENRDPASTSQTRQLKRKNIAESEQAIQQPARVKRLRVWKKGCLIPTKQPARVKRLRVWKKGCLIPATTIDFPPDPADPRWNSDGAICGCNGKLQLNAYMDDVLMRTFQNEPPRESHPDPVQPGMRQSEIDDPDIRQQHKCLRPWRDSKGMGWIVSRTLATGKTESLWISAKKFGSWRLALLLARLQRSVWLAQERVSQQPAQFKRCRIRKKSPVQERACSSASATVCQEKRNPIPANAFTRLSSGRAHIFDNIGEEFHQHLRVEGYAVLQGILGKQGSHEFCETFWDCMSHIVPGLERSCRGTWNFPKGSHGICASYGLPQADFAWKIRTCKRIHDAFSYIFSDNDLVVSTDAVLLVARRMGARPKPWLHRDQSPSLHIDSFQGIYSLYGCEKDRGGTILVPRSHKKIDRWESTAVGNFRRAPTSLQIKIWRHAIKPLVPPDSLLVFHSRLLHAGEGGRINRIDPSTGAALPERIAVPVAFCPKARRSERTRLRKIKAYHKGLATSHWPDDNFMLKRASRFEHIKGLRHLPMPPPEASERLDLL